MLRATVWTVGLFGAGTAISRLFPGAWTEPLVLLGLGLALLFVSARTARGTARPARARPAASAAPSVAVKPAALPAPAMEVERTA
jgi:hypothetical protein